MDDVLLPRPMDGLALQKDPQYVCDVGVHPQNGVLCGALLYLHAFYGVSCGCGVC